MSDDGRFGGGRWLGPKPSTQVEQGTTPYISGKGSPDEHQWSILRQIAENASERGPFVSHSSWESFFEGGTGKDVPATYATTRGMFSSPFGTAPEMMMFVATDGELRAYELMHVIAQLDVLASKCGCPGIDLVSLSTGSKSILMKVRDGAGSTTLGNFLTAAGLAISLGSASPPHEDKSFGSAGSDIAAQCGKVSEATARLMCFDHATAVAIKFGEKMPEGVSRNDAQRWLDTRRDQGAGLEEFEYRSWEAVIEQSGDGLRGLFARSPGRSVEINDRRGPGAAPLEPGYRYFLIGDMLYGEDGQPRSFLLRALLPR